MQANIRKQIQEGFEPKTFSYFFFPPPQLTEDINFFSLTAFSYCSCNTDTSAGGAILHLWQCLCLQAQLQLISAQLRDWWGEFSCDGVCWMQQCCVLLSSGFCCCCFPTVPIHPLQKSSKKTSSLGAESIWLWRQQDLLSDILCIRKHHLADRYFQESITALANTLSKLQRCLSVVESHRRGKLWHSCSPHSLAEF